MSLGKRLISTAAAGGIVGTDNFNTVLYSGNSSTQSITGVGFRPDFVWIKARNAIGQHSIFDSVRGVTKRLDSSSTSAEATVANSLTSFDSDGFSFGNESGNNSGENYVAWNWYAPTSETNNDGDVTATIKKNVDAGFSIVNYTATSGQSVGHGLGGAPDLIIKKPVTTEDWLIYNSVAGTGKYMSFTRNEQGGGAGTDGFVTRASSFPTVNSTVFSDNWTSASLNYTAYCFKNVAGYQAIGSYNGNSSTPPTVTTNFFPRFVVIKQTNGSNPWVVIDSARAPSNPASARLRLNATDAEYSAATEAINRSGTGFTVNSNWDGMNGDSKTYLYWAIA